MIHGFVLDCSQGPDGYGSGRGFGRGIGGRMGGRGFGESLYLLSFLYVVLTFKLFMQRAEICHPTLFEVEQGLSGKHLLQDIYVTGARCLVCSCSTIFFPYHSLKIYC